MHAPARGRRSGLPRGLIALAILCALPLRATIYVHPNLGFPRPLRDAVVISTSDGHHVIAVDRNGHELWRLGSRGEAEAMNVDDDHLIVQLGRDVLRVDPAGHQKRIARLQKGEVLVVDRVHHAAFSAIDDRFVMRDFETMAPLWTKTNCVDFVTMTSADVVLVTAIAKITRGPTGFETIDYSDAAIIALDRVTGRESWRRPSQSRWGPSARGAVVGPYLALFEGQDVTVVRLDTGEALPAIADAVDIAAAGDQLAILTSSSIVLADPATLRRIREIPTPTEENLRLAIDDGVAMTVGAYNAAAFDLASGRKLWEIREQVNATLSHRHVYASVGAHRNDDRARLIDVDLDSGRARELYSEKAVAARRTFRERIQARMYEWNRNRVLRRLERARAPATEIPLCIAGPAIQLWLGKQGMAEAVTDQLHKGRWSRKGETWSAVIGGVGNLDFTLERYRGFVIAEFRHPPATTVDLEQSREMIDMYWLGVEDGHDKPPEWAFIVVPCRWPQAPPAFDPSIPH